MPSFGIGVRRVLQRGLVGESSKPVFEYVLDPRLGTFPTRVEAKAAFMRSMDPALRDADDAFAARHFDRMARNTGHHKIMKVLT